MTALHKANGITAAYADQQYFTGYRLQGDDGSGPVYLDMIHLDRTTRNIKRAWIGSLEQSKAVRRKYPWTKTLERVRNAPPNNTRRD